MDDYKLFCINKRSVILFQPVASRKQINAWVARATRNLITEVFDPYSGNCDTVHVVVNAIYFKGEWQTPFKQENTMDLEFHLLDGSSLEVPFLRSWNDQCIACHDGFKVLKLPYQRYEEYNYDLYCSEPKFSMCVFLPEEREGLADLLEKITSSPEFLHNHLPTDLVPVGQFRLPKFKLAYESNIVSDLKSLGLAYPSVWRQT